MIYQEGGRWRSEPTEEERLSDIDDIVSKLTPEEYTALEAILGEFTSGGISEIADTCAENQWEEVPLPIEEWIESEYHVGDTGKTLFPVLKKDLIELFSNDYHEVILTGSIGWGKDYFGTVCMMRVLYELCCLKNPSRSLGLGAGEPIHIVPISRTVKHAQTVVFGGLEKKLAISPWFKGKYKYTMDYIEFPDKRILIKGGASSDAAALGLNVFMAFVDEANFMGAPSNQHKQNSAGGQTHDRAQMIFDALTRRVKSRYQRSGLKGMIILASSKRATDDFTERRIREHIKHKTTAGVFVRDYATWLVKPEPFANQKWYRCSVSSAEGRCRILEEGEEAPEDALVFTFPEDYFSEFQRDAAGCFTGNTKISLLDGREVPISDLVGVDEFWTYSFFPDGRFYPGRGHSARLVKKNAPIVEVELDNGERIRCTPDHRFMLRDGSYLPAMALQSGTSLMPLYRKDDKWGYEMLQSNVGGRWCHTHRLVAREYCNDGSRIPKGQVVHHEDFDKRNNAPFNLSPMLKSDHDKLHARFLSEGMHSAESRRKARETLNKRIKEDPDYRELLCNSLKKARDVYVGTDKHRKTASRNGKKYGFGDNNNPNIAAARSRNGTKNITKLNLSENNPIYKPENRAAASKRLKEMDEKTRHKATMAGLHSRWGHEGSVEGCERCDSRGIVAQVLDCADQGLDVREAAKEIGLTPQGLYYILQREEMLSYAQIRDRGLADIYLDLINDADLELPLGRGVELADEQMSRKESGVRASHKRWHSGGFEQCIKCREALNRPKTITKPQVVKVTQDGILYGLENGLTPTQLAEQLGCKTPAITGWLKRRDLPTYMKLLKDPLLREEIFTPAAPGNHQVIAVHLTGDFEDVYDITVDVTHNFALSSGVVVSNSTRDVAGIATDTYSPFISKREAIEEMFDPEMPHLFEAREWEMGRALTINWKEVMTTDARGDKVPWCCPQQSRHVHIDLSKNMCATGLCMAHQAGTTEVVRLDASTGEKSIEEVAVYHVDGILRILAGPAGDIDHSEVRGLIYKLNEGGFNVRSVSMDHWMSVPNMQIFKKHGFRVEEISTVKKIDPFDTARTALYENRIKSPEYDMLRQELRVLELDPKRPLDRPKIVVPAGHTKDVADAFAGAVYYLAKHQRGGIFIAPTHGLSAAPQTGKNKVNWKDSNPVWGDEEGYDLLPDPEWNGGKGTDPYEGSWFL